MGVYEHDKVPKSPSEPAVSQGLGTDVPTPEYLKGDEGDYHDRNMPPEKDSKPVSPE